MSRLEPKPSTVKALWSKSAGMCNICKADLWRLKGDGDNYSVGQVAHICAAEAGGPRFNPEFSDEDNRSYQNLMILCPTHHGEVDNDYEKYSADDLRSKKMEHEDWIRSELATQISNLGYPELEVIIKYVETAKNVSQSSDLSLTQISEKIKKNELGDQTENLIRMGLTQAPNISSYLNNFPDPQFEQNLRNIFINKYNEARDTGLASDELFCEMVEFAKGPYSSIPRYGAAVSLITYFFERCDIFEK